MSTAVATTEKRASGAGMGRPSKLTPEVHKALIEALRMGASVKLASAKVKVAERTVLEWIQRGNDTHSVRPTDDRYAHFAQDVSKAMTAVDYRALKALNKQLNGYRCKACNNGTVENSEGQVQQCPCCKGSLWVGRPDGRLGLSVLERREAGYARSDRVKHEHTVSGSVTVDVHVEHTSTSVATSLLSMQSGQLSSILDRLDAPEVIEAEVVEGGG